MGQALDSALVVVATDRDEMLVPLRDALRAAGLQVVTCRQVRTAREAIDFHRPEVVVVDVGMQGDRGWDVLHAARRHVGLSVIVVLRSPDTLARRSAFAAGADDVVDPPHDVQEIAARTATVAGRHRAETRAAPVYRHRDLVVDVAAQEARLRGRPIRLTPQQFAILAALCEARGAALHRSHLVARIGSLDDEAASERSVDLHVSRLRHRLGDDAQHPRYVQAVYGVGYRLAIDHDAREGLTEDLAAMLDALPDALLVLDDRLRVSFANHAAEALLGRDRVDVLGAPCEAILQCRSCEGTALAGPRCLGRVVLAGSSGLRDVDAVVHVPSGTLRVLFSHTRVRLDGGREVVAISIRPSSPGGPEAPAAGA